MATAVMTTIDLTGHLFDSLTLSTVMDTINGAGGSFKITHMAIGQTKDAISNIRMELHADDDATLQAIKDQLDTYIAKTPVDFGDSAQLANVTHTTTQRRYPLGKDDKHPTILMCPPDYFTVDYAINPWMQHADSPVNIELAKQQWETLRQAIADAGAKVEILPPQPGLPDLVFTANCAFVYGDQAVTAHYRHSERQGEEPFGQTWFKERGYNVTALPDHIHFEGSGDALIWNNRVFAGYKMRSDLAAHSYLSQASGLPVMSLELSDPKFYHVDVCFCPLTDDYLIWYPGAFNEYGRSVIEANVPAEKRIAVTDEEANTFVCNAVCVDKTVIFNVGAPRVKAELESKGFNVVQVDMSEFLKSGGSCKCLTVRLDH